LRRTFHYDRSIGRALFNGGDEGDLMITHPISEVFKSKDIKGIVAVAPSATVAEAVGVMCRNGIGAVIISSTGSDVDGIFTERDVMARVVDEGRDAKTTRVDAVMSREVRSIPSTLPMDDALRLMVEHNYRHLVVQDDAEVRGIVSIRDLMRQAILTDAPPHEGRPGVLRSRTDDALDTLRQAKGTPVGRA